MRRAAVLLTAVLVFGAAGPAFADHDYDDGWDESGGGQEYDQNYGSRDDRNRNRGRDRGAFSPGPFRDSPVDAFNNVCMPGATCHYGGGTGGEKGEGGTDGSPSEGG